MSDQEGATGSDLTLRRTKADWDNYFKEKMVELRKLINESGEYLNPNMAKK
jgi:hypothetical protein